MRYLIILAVLLCSVAYVSAQDKDKPKPITGVLAGSTTNTGAIDYAGEGESGPNPITGSVEKQRPGRLVVKITNTSENERYSADFELQLLDRHGRKVKSEYFSYTLSPKERKERVVTVSSAVENSMLVMTKVKNLTKG